MRHRKTDAGRGLIATDLDRTLLRPDGTISPRDLQALESARRDGITCVLATGRNLLSLRRALGNLADLPVDYVVFSTGLGILGNPSGQLLVAHGLDADQSRRAASCLIDLDVDLTIHAPVPDNHRFAYRRANGQNSDLEQRVALYTEHCQPLDGSLDGLGSTAQLVGMCAPDRGAWVWPRAVQALGNDFHVVRTTSPLDHESLWVEVLPRGVNKGGALQWLCARLDIPRQHTLAVGNDFNDLDMLQWTGAAYVTDEAPQKLRDRWPAAGSFEVDAVSRAIGRWRDGGTASPRQ